MKKFVLCLLTISFLTVGCGISQREAEMVGQVKAVVPKTPLICYDHDEVDVSLGVMRNGVGSMSTEDRWLYVPDSHDSEVLKKAAETGQLVKITYDKYRLTFCIPEFVVRKVEPVN